MRIRRMRKQDLEQAAKLEKECFGQSAWSQKAFADALADENALYLAAVEEEGGSAEGEGKDGSAKGEREDVCAEGEGSPERLAGICGVWQSLEEGEIMNVAVCLDRRGQGYGRMLMEELLRRAAARGVRSFFLEVRKGNLPAIRLYRSLGFEEVGLRKGFYSAPAEDALVMRKEWPGEEMRVEME